MNSISHIKPEIRILGIDDSALISDQILIVGAFFHGGEWLDGVMSSRITRDGMDGTETIINMTTSSKHYGQIRVIMLDGVTYGGFNPVDIARIHEATGISVIVLMRALPDLDMIRAALEHLPQSRERMRIIQRAGAITRVVTKDVSNPVFIQCAGIDTDTACQIVTLAATRSNIPEPLRVAHLIATGIICGESCGKA
ncbi:MAG: endonuclease dU [Methanosarcinaceae archaeon]